MRTSDIEFVHALVEEMPALRPLLDEHLEDNFNEVLAHLFLADVLRWVVANPDRSSEERLFGLLDDAFRTGDGERQELISTGFLENVPRQGEPGEGIRFALPAALRKEADRVS